MSSFPKVIASSLPSLFLDVAFFRCDCVTKSWAVHSTCLQGVTKPRLLPSLARTIFLRICSGEGGLVPRSGNSVEINSLSCVLFCPTLPRGSGTNLLFLGSVLGLWNTREHLFAFRQHSRHWSGKQERSAVPPSSGRAISVVARRDCRQACSNQSTKSKRVDRRSLEFSRMSVGVTQIPQQFRCAVL